MIADLFVNSRVDRDAQLDHAVAAAQQELQDLPYGILVTRQDYARFTVSLTPAVPFGQIQELDQASRLK
ncbi:hypothetical protein J7I89_04035 [Arthrobacter sp. ISL-5]|nr:hypothetical protein [Arthrobacter sp. ISL-5]